MKRNLTYLSCIFFIASTSLYSSEIQTSNTQQSVQNKKRVLPLVPLFDGSPQTSTADKENISVSLLPISTEMKPKTLVTTAQPISQPISNAVVQTAHTTVSIESIAHTLTSFVPRGGSSALASKQLPKPQARRGQKRALESSNDTRSFAQIFIESLEREKRAQLLRHAKLEKTLQDAAAKLMQPCMVPATEFTLNSKGITSCRRTEMLASSYRASIVEQSYSTQLTGRTNPTDLIKRLMTIQDKDAQDVYMSFNCNGLVHIDPASASSLAAMNTLMNFKF